MTSTPYCVQVYYRVEEEVKENNINESTTSLSEAAVQKSAQEIGALEEEAGQKLVPGMEASEDDA